MAKALQAATQERHKATRPQIHPANHGRGLEYVGPFGPDHAAAGRRAVLVTERSAAFDAPLPPVEETKRSGVAVDPTWDHKDFTRWTPDLVHHRLLLAGTVISTMPPVLRRQYVSFVGSEALGEMGAGRETASPAAITLANWTWDRISERPGTQRVILVGMAFGLSAKTVSGCLLRMSRVGTVGVKLLESRAVSYWYLKERRHLATAWQSGRYMVAGVERHYGVEAMLDPATVNLFRAEQENNKK